MTGVQTCALPIFTAVSPLIAIGMAASGGAGGTGGLPAMYGSIIAAGILTFVAAPYFARLLRFFPPVVTGTLLTVMGTTLMSVSAGDIVSPGANAPEGASEALVGALTLRGLGYALLTIALIVAVQRVFKGFIATISVLIGLVAATGAAAALGDVDFSGVAAAAPLGVTTPFYFGVPRLSAAGIASMVIIMAVTEIGRAHV